MINDTHGHAAEDAILVETAKVLLAHLRKGDVCARWGGEEFLVLLAEAELSQTVVVAKRLRLTDTCLKHRDTCLYIAKDSGRNQVWCQPAEGEPGRVSGPPA